MASVKANARIDVAVELSSTEMGEKLPALLGVLPAGVESRLVSNDGNASIHISLVGRYAELRDTVDAIAASVSVAGSEV